MRVTDIGLSRPIALMLSRNIIFIEKVKAIDTIFLVLQKEFKYKVKEDYNDVVLNRDHIKHKILEKLYVEHNLNLEVEEDGDEMLRVSRQKLQSFYKDKFQMIADLCKNTGIQLVLSSSWCNFEYINTIKELESGINADFFKIITPYIVGIIPRNYHLSRCGEIDLFLMCIQANTFQYLYDI